MIDEIRPGPRRPEAIFELQGMGEAGPTLSSVPCTEDAVWGTLSFSTPFPRVQLRTYLDKSSPRLDVSQAT